MSEERKKENLTEESGGKRRYKKGGKEWTYIKGFGRERKGVNDW